MQAIGPAREFLYFTRVIPSGFPIPMMPAATPVDRVFIMVVYTGFFLPISIWIAKGFFDAIPRELEEAAHIDGCSPVGGLVRIAAFLTLIVLRPLPPELARPFKVPGGPLVPYVSALPG